MQSGTARPKFERMGDMVLINLNERTHLNPLTDSFDSYVEQFTYDSTKLPLLAQRREVIQSVMRIKYPDIDSEFAARVNGGLELEQHEEWRQLAKIAADGFEQYVVSQL